MPQSGVKITISDVEYIQGKSGVGMRCTLNMAAQHPEHGAIVQSTKGCLAFRNKKGEINFLTPVIYLGAARVRHRPIVLSPGLAKWLETECERAHGTFIKRNPTRAGSGVAAWRQGADVELELGEAL